MYSFRRALWLVIGLVLLPQAAAAQNSTIRGVVADRQGGVVVGAEVLLTGEAVPMRSTTTQTDGAFAFDTVRPGQYTLQVNSPGFASWSQVVRPADEGATLMVTLDIAGLSETVGVVGTGVSTMSVPAPTATRLGLTPLETPASLTIVTGDTIWQRGDVTWRTPRRAWSASRARGRPATAAAPACRAGLAASIR